MIENGLKIFANNEQKRRTSAGLKGKTRNFRPRVKTESKHQHPLWEVERVTLLEYYHGAIAPTSPEVEKYDST